jgi:hypothetical protein
VVLARWICVALFGLGCSSKPEKPLHPGSQASASETEAGTETAESDAAVDSGSVMGGAMVDAAKDAGPRAVVRMGVNPVPAEDLGLADLDVIAVGSQATTVALRWGSDDIEAAIGRARWFKGQDLTVLFAIDALQGAAVGDLDLEARSQWVYAAVDALYAADVPVDAVVMGEALDLAIEQLEEAERKTLEASVGKWLTHASRHPDRPKDSLVGIHTWAGAWRAPSPELIKLSTRAELVALSWHGLDAAGYAQTVSSAKSDLDEQLTAAEAVAARVWIRELSYPSAVVAKSRLSQQAKAYTQLWGLFAEHPDRQPFVAVSGLYDPPNGECERFAATYALPERASDAYCSIGLKEADDSMRPAFSSLVAGMAALAPGFSKAAANP